MNMIETRMEQRGQGGFTLIELLVVIAILAVLAGAAIIGIGAMRDNAKKTACASDKDTVETAAEAYRIDKDATAYETTLTNLLSAKYIKKNLSVGDFTIDASTGDATNGQAAGNKYADVATADCD